MLRDLLRSARLPIAFPLFAPALIALALIALALIVLAVGPAARAQAPARPEPYRLTVIVSDLGAAAPRGLLERRVAEAWAARRASLGGIYGRELDVRVVGDAGTPVRAARAARDAIEAGAHALVCCSTPAATSQVAPVAARAGVPLLSPTAGGVDEAAGWQFVLAADEATQLQAVVRDAYARGVSRLGIMTLEGSFGDTAVERLRSFLGVPELQLVAEARYPAGATVLTPEALRVATREPGTIVVWGLRADTALAVRGLRERGWHGPVYLRAALLDPLAGGLPSGLSGEVRVPVSPASLPSSVDADDPAASWLFDARGLGDGRLESRAYLADGATMHDALVLLGRAFEQAAGYGVDPADLRGFRLALRDALVALPETTLAAGRYDLEMDATQAALAQGLTMGHLVAGRLAPLR